MRGMEKLISWLDGERGRRVTLARQLDISPSNLSMWKRIPAERVLTIEHLTGIDRADLRPDLYKGHGALSAVGGM